GAGHPQGATAPPRCRPPWGLVGRDDRRAEVDAVDRQEHVERAGRSKASLVPGCMVTFSLSLTTRSDTALGRHGLGPREHAISADHSLVGLSSWSRSETMLGRRSAPAIHSYAPPASAPLANHSSSAAAHASVRLSLPWILKIR